MRKFTMSPAIEGEFEDACQTLHLSQPAFIELALIEYLASKDKFVICPSCDTYLAVKSLIDVPIPVKRFNCQCGCSLWYDTTNESVIGWKKHS